MPSASAPSKPRCNARKRQGGGRCKHPAGYGTDHLGFGHCKFHSGSTAAGKDHAKRVEARALADALHVEPYAAIQQSLDKANGMLAFFETKIAALPEKAVLSKGQLNVWIREYRAANSDVAHYAKLAVDAGVAERYVRVAEHTADAVARAFDHLLGELDLNKAQLRKAPAAVRASLQLVEAPPVAAAS